MRCSAPTGPRKARPDDKLRAEPRRARPSKSALADLDTKPAEIGQGPISVAPRPASFEARLRRAPQDEGQGLQSRDGLGLNDGDFQLAIVHGVGGGIEAIAQRGPLRPLGFAAKAQ
jgi:hypothetical protein